MVYYPGLSLFLYTNPGLLLAFIASYIAALGNTCLLFNYYLTPSIPYLSFFMTLNLSLNLSFPVLFFFFQTLPCVGIDLACTVLAFNCTSVDLNLILTFTLTFIYPFIFTLPSPYLYIKLVTVNLISGVIRMVRLIYEKLYPLHGD